jgi:hypothetical protein
MDLDFLKAQYDSEIERKEKLTESLALPAGVLIALGGAIGLMAQSFSYRNPALRDFFVWTLGADAVTFGVCLVCLASAYHGQEYEYLPRLGQLHEAERRLLEWYEQVGGTRAEAKADFEAELTDRIIKAADRNALSNDIRSGYLYWARVTLFLVLALAAVAGFAYVLDAAYKPNVIPVIRIENLGELRKELINGESSSDAASASKARIP